MPTYTTIIEIENAKLSAYLAELAAVQLDRDRRYALYQEELALKRATAASMELMAVNLDILADKIMLSVMATRRLDDRLSSTASDATADAAIARSVRESVAVMDSVQAILTAREGAAPTPDGDPPAVLPPVGDQPAEPPGGV